MLSLFQDLGLISFLAKAVTAHRRSARLETHSLTLDEIDAHTIIIIIIIIIEMGLAD
jgi:hypothetical protein